MAIKTKRARLMTVKVDPETDLRAKVDKFAKLSEKYRSLKKEFEALQKELKNAINVSLEGYEYEVVKCVTTRVSLDTKRIKEDMGKEWVAKYSREGTAVELVVVPLVKKRK